MAVYEKGYPVMERYFQDSSDGVLNFLNDLEALDNEWVTLNEDGSWDINFGIGDDEEIAQALSDMYGIQVSAEELQIILRKLHDYGFDIDLDSCYSDLEDLKSIAE